MEKTTENRAIKKEEGDAKSAIWDCGSLLYDSFELASLSHLIERHLMVLPCLSSGKGSSSLDVFRAVPLLDIADCRCEKKGSFSIRKMLAGILGKKVKRKKLPKTKVFGCYNFRTSRVGLERNR
ncbi:hypothetical protein SLA2020_512170 [Shorea laevis]